MIECVLCETPRLVVLLSLVFKLTLTMPAEPGVQFGIWHMILQLLLLLQKEEERDYLNERAGDCKETHHHWPESVLLVKIVLIVATLHGRQLLGPLRPNGR